MRIYRPVAMSEAKSVISRPEQRTTAETNAMFCYVNGKSKIPILIST